MLRNELLFVLGINTGLRISDILSLDIADVLPNKGGLNRIELQEKKTKKNRATKAIIRKAGTPAGRV